MVIADEWHVTLDYPASLRADEAELMRTVVDPALRDWARRHLAELRRRQQEVNPDGQSVAVLRRILLGASKLIGSTSSRAAMRSKDLSVRLRSPRSRPPT
jgi:hypothetical protein